MASRDIHGWRWHGAGYGAGRKAEKLQNTDVRIDNMGIWGDGTGSRRHWRSADLRCGSAEWGSKWVRRPAHGVGLRASGLLWDPRQHSCDVSFIPSTRAGWWGRHKTVVACYKTRCHLMFCTGGVRPFALWWRGDDGVKASSLIHGNGDRKLLCQVDVGICSKWPASWKTPREGLMNIAASFPSVMKPRLSIQ
jgi:hypothetical protein